MVDWSGSGDGDKDGTRMDWEGEMEVEKEMEAETEGEEVEEGDDAGDGDGKGDEEVETGTGGWITNDIEESVAIKRDIARAIVKRMGGKGVALAELLSGSWKSFSRESVVST